MATFREIINTVLRTLREDEVDTGETTLADDYHKLIATFVNQIKEEVENAHNWRDLRQTHSATVLASANQGTITNATRRSRVCRAKAEDGLIPLVFDVTNASNPIPLTEVPLSEIDYRIATDVPGTATEPCMFALVSPGNGTLAIRVYPKPTSNRTISLVMATPQARLDDDDLDVEVLIPNLPIEMGAIWYALEERGEEMGVNALFTEERWRKAIDDAIAIDDAEQGGNDLVVV